MARGLLNLNRQSKIELIRIIQELTDILNALACWGQENPDRSLSCLDEPSAARTAREVLKKHNLQPEDVK